MGELEGRKVGGKVGAVGTIVGGDVTIGGVAAADGLTVGCLLG